MIKMIKFNLTPENFRRIEFWAVTASYLIAIFFLLTVTVNNNFRWYPNKYFFDRANLQYNYFTNYFFPMVIRYSTFYLLFLLLNFQVVPQILKRINLLKNIFLILFSLGLVWIVFAVTDTYIKTFQLRNYPTDYEAYVVIFQNRAIYAIWLMFMFAFYTCIKFSSFYLLNNFKLIHEKYKMITPGGVVAIVLWMIGIFLLLAGEADMQFIAAMAIIIPYGIGLYWYSFFSLIPNSIKEKKPVKSFIFKTILTLIITYLPVVIIGIPFVDNPGEAFAIATFNILVQLLLTTPLTWIIYKKFNENSSEVFTLKKELGQTSANFDFLRSQINPHFLFNALNTLYGTAIQEKAERTGEGVQKLGDMMRFMLQENMEEKVQLSREIEYLENYISLQRLRTDVNPMINILTEIQSDVKNVHIAPMLLIPFVENAFKHGISFREPSFINISLELKEGILYFDVNNSKHIKRSDDPEKYKGGIGLNNVKQRLQLIYPNQHELIIRETSKGFFVHLTVELKKVGRSKFAEVLPG
jgi:two-component system, LytTR family, sensor kinase